jgi:peptidyl-prolyl cis-trans isomerase A (cyclophilin A)
MKRKIALLTLAGFALLGSCNAQKTAAAEDAAAPQVKAAAERVRLKTNKGDIVIELNSEKAPVTVANFLNYVGDKHYDGTVFHRVIDGFMIQGGGYALDDGKLVEKKTGVGIKNESQNGLKNDEGTIAMARTNDPNSATAQFFINVKDNASLNFPSNGGYAVFGKVVEGMEVVNQIKTVATKQGLDGTSSMPVEPVVIESATAE